RRLGPWESRPGQRNRHRRSGPEVPGAADDLSRLPLADVHLAELEPVRVRMLACLDHLADLEEAKVAVHVGHAELEHPLDLERRDRKPARELLRRRVDVDVLAQPGKRNPHQWLTW